MLTCGMCFRTLLVLVGQDQSSESSSSQGGWGFEHGGLVTGLADLLRWCSHCLIQR